MGKSRESSTTVVNQQQTPQPTPEETRRSQIENEALERISPRQTDVQLSGLELVEKLLRGESNLPGFFQQLSAGISPEVTGDIAQEAIADITPSFAQSGLLDSGVRASVSGRIAGDIRRGAEEFNIGNKLNLLNLALSGQAQVQTPVLQRSQLLNQQLAGLRGQSFSGTTSQNISRPNPFLQSFQTGAGNVLGRGAGAGAILGLGGALGFCWAAAELFGGWDRMDTTYTRHYMLFKAPKWLLKFYAKFGERLANLIRKHIVIRKISMPMFRYFAKRGRE